MQTFNIILILLLKTMSPKQIVRVKAIKIVVLLDNYISGGPEYSYWHQSRKPFCGPSLAFKTAPEIFVLISA